MKAHKLWSSFTVAFTIIWIAAVGLNQVDFTSDVNQNILSRNQVIQILDQYQEAGDLATKAENPRLWTPDASRNFARVEITKHNWTSKHYDCLDELWTRESNWRTKAENKSSGAYGIPQALPAEKMAVIADDYRSNPATQIKWGIAYIKSRYNNPCKALEHHDRRNWY